MRKIINDPDNIVEEMMEGFIAAYHHMYYKHPEVNSVISRCRRKNKVSLIIGGGSGHEPMFSGFVGAGLADAACCGNIFASPDPKNIYETGKSIDDANESIQDEEDEDLQNDPNDGLGGDLNEDTVNDFRII